MSIEILTPSDCQTTLLVREVEVNRLEGVVEANGLTTIVKNRGWVNKRKREKENQKEKWMATEAVMEYLTRPSRIGADVRSNNFVNEWVREQNEGDKQRESHLGRSEGKNQGRTAKPKGKELPIRRRGHDSRHSWSSGQWQVNISLFSILHTAQPRHIQHVRQTVRHWCDTMYSTSIYMRGWQLVKPLVVLLSRLNESSNILLDLRTSASSCQPGTGSLQTQLHTPSSPMRNFMYTRT
jgi:hypothetical protein